MPEIITVVQDDLNLDKLTLLKQRMKEKQNQESSEESKVEDMPAKIMMPPRKSIRWGVLGAGAAGSKLAEVFYNLGYQTIVMNTAIQDLEGIKIPETNKLHTEYGLNGAGKSLEIGEGAATAYMDHLYEMVATKLDSAQALVYCLSLGGGSGAGSLTPVIEVLGKIGLPVIVIAVLPMDSEDAGTKSNSITTLAKLSKLVQEKKVQSVICADNARIETIYKDVGQLSFYEVANKAIVEPIDLLNILSSKSSAIALDSTDYAKIMLDGEGFCVFSSMKVANYQDEVALATAVIDKLDGNLLAAGFNLESSKYAGFIVCGSKAVLEKIPSSATNYASTMIQDKCGAVTLFKGVYVTDSTEDCAVVYSVFSGLSLPESRVTSLQKEVKEAQEQMKAKTERRQVNLSINTGDETISAAQKVKDQIASKSSSFSKFFAGNVDKRK